MSAPEQTQGVLLRYAGGEVYGLLNTVPNVLLSMRVAGIDIVPPLRGPHAVMADDVGALVTSATLTQMRDELAARIRARMEREAAEHARVALEMERTPKRPAKRTGKAKAKAARRGAR